MSAPRTPSAWRAANAAADAYVAKLCPGAAGHKVRVRTPEGGAVTASLLVGRGAGKVETVVVAKAPTRTDALRALAERLRLAMERGCAAKASWAAWWTTPANIPAQPPDGPPEAPPPPPPPPRASTPRHHRATAKAVAAEVVPKLAPWSVGWRLNTSRPDPRYAWQGNHYACVIARCRVGTERVFADAQAPTEAAALDALTATLRAMLAAGAAVPEREVSDEQFAAWEEAFRRAGGGYTRTGSRTDAPPRVGAADADLRALGLDAMPDRGGLRRAWREAALKHHPDHGGDPERFKAARGAYERLVEACR